MFDMFFNDDNDFAGANFVYSIPEKSNFGFSGYHLEETNGEPSARATQTGGFDLDATVSGFGTAEDESWWLGPGSDGGAGQYAGSTLLNPSYDEFAGLYDFQAGYISGSNGSHTALDDVHGFDALGQQHMNVPESQGPSMAGPSTVPYPARPAQSPSPPPATFTSLRTTTSPVPTLSWGYSPLPTTLYATAGNNQPLTEQNSGGQWPYPTSVGKGKARATDHLPIHPSTTGNTMWQYQQPYTPQDYDAGSNPLMGAGVPDTNLSTQIAPSTGPRRSVRGAKGKGKEVDKGKGKQKRIPLEDLPPDFNWSNTHDRFCAEMAKIYFNKPTGGVTNPETAYARINQFVKDDLYLSPLVVKVLGKRPSRDLEQYLNGVLNELRPRRAEQKRGVRYMLDRVAQELENELIIVNDGFALLDGPSNEVDPEELDDSEKGVKRRTSEQVRRDAIRHNLERMSLFFKVPEPKYLWSGPQVLFFATTYVVFGAGAFENWSSFIVPKPRL